MNRARRRLLLAAAAALTTPAYGQPMALLRKQIPSSGEEIPIIGRCTGTPKRW
ncbi:MAG: hypothetical protein ACREUN_14665 [Burkholderiales bacterium]